MLNKSFPLLLLLALLVAGLTSQVLAADDSADEPRESLSVAQITAKVRPSLATIRVSGRDGGDQGIGTGFVISSDGMIATNLHVIGRGREFTVELADGRKLKPQFVHASDNAVDLAVVRVDVGDRPLPELPLGDSDQVQQGTPVVVMGNPWGLQNSVVSGVVSAIREIDGQDMLQLAMPIEPGNSGGPVVDMQGHVYGVVNMKSTVKRSVGFAVQINKLKVLLEKPNPIPVQRWVTIGAIDRAQWSPLFGARWHQQAGRILVSGPGQGFGGRALCLSTLPAPQPPYELAVAVKMDDESGAAGLIFHSDGDNKHYGFYPSNGNLRLTCFRGPTVYSWQVLFDKPSEHYRPGTWNHLKVRIEKDKLLCYVNDRLVLESADQTFSAGQVGLAKFRHTKAEFRDFRLAKEIPPSQVADDDLERAAASIDKLAALANLTPQELEGLAESARASITVLQSRRSKIEEQARFLEQQAENLRRLASDIHVRDVTRRLAELVEAHQEQEAPFDLLTGALLIAMLDEKDIDLEVYRREADRMAGQIRQSLAEDADPAARLAALNKYLFTDNGFHGSRFDYYHRANSYINRAIDDREGLPITLSVLYIELGRRLDLNIRGVGLPSHFVVKFVPAEGPEQLIDVFDGGKTMTREDADRIVRGATGEPLQEEHLQASTGPEILARMLANLYGLAEQRQDAEAMLRYLEARVAVDPATIQLRGMRAVFRAQTGRHAGALADLDWILDQEPDGIDLDQVRQMRSFILRQSMPP